jgi:hypothetical protein
MATAAQGALAKLYHQEGSGASLTFDAPTAEAMEFISENIQASQALLDTIGIRGTRSVPYGRTRLGVRTVGGSIVTNPSPAELNTWLPRFMGTAEAATDKFGLGDTFTAFGIYVDRVTEQFGYQDCFVTRASFRAQAGGMVEMTLDIIGGDETKGYTPPSTAPTLSVTAAYEPLVFHDACGAVDLPSLDASEIFDMEITIDNAMDARFVNCVTTTSVTATDRVVTLSVTVPYDSKHEGLYRNASEPGSGGRGGPGSITFTNNGDFSTQFDFASLDGPDVSPVVNGKQEIVLRLDYRARSTATTW